jgi:hypothetical protein
MVTFLCSRTLGEPKIGDGRRHCGTSLVVLTGGQAIPNIPGSTPSRGVEPHFRDDLAQYFTVKYGEFARHLAIIVRRDY